MYPLIPVLFRHSVLFLVPVEGQPFVLMKPLVLAMGLVWSVQQEKLLKDVRWHAQTLPLADADGAAAAVCLPLRKRFGWLTSLRPYQAKAATISRLSNERRRDPLERLAQGRIRPADRTARGADSRPRTGIDTRRRSARGGPSGAADRTGRGDGS